MNFEKRIETKLELSGLPNLSAATQGVCIQAYVGGRKTHDYEFGKTYKYYDLASLTKILFTVPSLMKAVDSKNLRLSDNISKHLDWWPFPKMSVASVVSHRAGLPWWAPFYKKYLKKKNKGFLSRDEVRQILLGQVQNYQIPKSPKAVYSDLDFILLGFLLEEIFDNTLIHIWQSSLWSTKLPSLHFNEDNKPHFNRNLYAPTEKCPWRQKTLRGEVHDDNTWSFGGVSTHAGLFGTTQDVSNWGLMLRKGMRGEKSPLGSAEVVKKFTRRAVPQKSGDWAFGFMMPTPGLSSAGKYLSKKSIGHTGFTGTSFWYDPKFDVMISILSNRVYPTRKNDKFVSLRPLLHDCIIEDLQASGRL